ncbi:18272_t:CDS:2 [Rhizophagus irregularis]|nr:18272_t:CDS:2 [Rhizophagus irregularis]
MGPFASELHVKPCSQQPVPQGGHMQVAGAAASCLLVNAPIMILGLGLAESNISEEILNNNDEKEGIYAWNAINAGFLAKVIGINMAHLIKNPVGRFYHADRDENLTVKKKSISIIRGLRRRM